MSRKDTILIAVLVNAALLVGLFVTAIKHEDGVAEKTIAEVKTIEIPNQPKIEIKTAQGDEIDQVLKEFSKKTIPQQKVELVKEEKTAAPQQIDFAKELEAITKASPPTSAKIATSAKPSATASGYLEVKVRKGDALEKIARAHQTSVSQLIELNQLKSTVLQIGQTLKIPKTFKDEKKQVASQVAASPPTKAEFYVVKAGDNPWSIAVKNQLKLEELLKLNNLDEQKARHLKPGDKLRIK